MSLPPSILEDNDQTRARREHLEALRALVGNAYPSKFRRSNVAATREGEDTVTALADPEIIKRVVNDEAFAEAFDALHERVTGGARPTPEELAPLNEKLNSVAVRVSGRLATPPRVMGKAAFVHLSDGRERLQIYVRRQEARAVSNDTGAPIDDPEGGWKLFQLLDHGDFVGVDGFLFVTKTGELSIHVGELQFLAKALLPMPDKMHGVADPEIRQRQRYVDLLAGSLKIDVEGDEAEGRGRELTTREVFERRSRMITELRRYLDAHGYVEVETPMLSPIASGAAARPFKTHHNALDIDLYARIAPELYLKRLLVGGFERVYELNRNFRNEGIGYRWNPEFTMLEFYCAYMDSNGMMDFCEELLRTVAQRVTGNTFVFYARLFIDPRKGLTEDPSLMYDFRAKRLVIDKIDFSKIERLSMKQAIGTHIGRGLQEVEPHELDIDGESFNASWLDDSQRVRILAKFFKRDYRQQARSNIPEDGDFDFSVEAANVELEEWRLAVEDLKSQSFEPTEQETSRDIVFLFETLAEEHLIQPTFITDFPKPVSPLSKASPENPAVAERFELYAAGMEIANGFSELNDPVEQYERFLDQMRQRERGDEEAMRMDEDYVRALSYGMPPAAGIGIGVDRLAMLLTNRRTIREVILFPHMRPRATAEESATDADADAPAEEPGDSQASG